MEREQTTMKEFENAIKEKRMRNKIVVTDIVELFKKEGLSYINAMEILSETRELLKEASLRNQV